MNTEYYLIAPDGSKVKLNINQMTYETTNPNATMKFTIDADVKHVVKPYQGKFGGYLTSDTYITKVIVNKPAYIVFWSDGTKTTAKCSDEDNFDAEKGLMLCVLKKMQSAEWIYKLMDDWCVCDNGSLTLSDVRAMNRANKKNK